MGVTAFLSMWISNTATTAMMAPIVQAILDQLNAKVELEYSSTKDQSAMPQQQEKKPNSIQQNDPPNIQANGMKPYKNPGRMYTHPHTHTQFSEDNLAMQFYSTDSF